jgi:hypothetical protein
MATKKALMVSNPRRVRRRKRRRGHTRRNPLVRSNIGGAGIMAAVKAAAPTGGGGVVGGFMVGFADAKLFGDKPVLSILTKLGVAVAAIGLLGKRAPNFAAGIAGGAIGGLGYSIGVKLGGGMVAHTREQAIQGLGEMADEAGGELRDIVDQSGIGDVYDEMRGAGDELASDADEEGGSGDGIDDIVDQMSDGDDERAYN